MDLVFAILPIVVLIYVMTKNVGWPSHQALPFAAFLVYGILLILDLSGFDWLYLVFHSGRHDTFVDVVYISNAAGPQDLADEARSGYGRGHPAGGSAVE